MMVVLGLAIFIHDMRNSKLRNYYKLRYSQYAEWITNNSFRSRNNSISSSSNLHTWYGDSKLGLCYNLNPKIQCTRNTQINQISVHAYEVRLFWAIYGTGHYPCPDPSAGLAIHLHYYIQKITMHERERKLQNGNLQCLTCRV